MPTNKCKSDKAFIKVGEHSVIINKYGGLVNPAHIGVWSRKNVLDYVKFLKKLLPYLED